jgi:hypothetical protein
MWFSISLACIVALATAVPAPQWSTYPNVTSSSTQNATTPAWNTESAVICEGNAAEDRMKWCDDSIDTDWYNYVPNTGVTREVCSYITTPCQLRTASSFEEYD